MNAYEDEDPTSVQGPPPPPGRPLNQSQKSAIAAALVGTAALGGAAYGMAQWLNDDSVADDPDGGKSPGGTPSSSHLPPDPPLVSKVENNPATTHPEIPAEPLVDHKNYDDLTFKEAFHESRLAMGKGHFFEWHGQLYNTYHKDEWEQMTPGQHNVFLASVYGDDAPELHGGNAAAGMHGGHGTAPGMHAGHSTAPVLAGHTAAIPPPPDVPVAVDDDPKADNSRSAVADAAGSHHLSATTDSDVVVEDNTRGHDITDLHHSSIADAGTVTVDDHASGPNVQLADEADIAVVDDGHDVAVIDADHDGHPDAVSGSDHHDHTLDTPGSYDSAGHHTLDEHALADHTHLDMGLDSLHQPDIHQDALFTTESEFGTDFNNNADVSDFA